MLRRGDDIFLVDEDGSITVYEYDGSEASLPPRYRLHAACAAGARRPGSGAEAWWSSRTEPARSVVEAIAEDPSVLDQPGQSLTAGQTLVEKAERIGGFRYLVNPTRQELEGLCRKALDGEVRGVVYEGDVYVWDAEKFTHEQFIRGLLGAAPNDIQGKDAFIMRCKEGAVLSPAEAEPMLREKAPGFLRLVNSFADRVKEGVFEDAAPVRDELTRYGGEVFVIEPVSGDVLRADFSEARTPEELWFGHERHENLELSQMAVRGYWLPRSRTLAIQPTPYATHSFEENARRAKNALGVSPKRVVEYADRALADFRTRIAKESEQVDENDFRPVPDEQADDVQVRDLEFRIIDDDIVSPGEHEWVLGAFYGPYVVGMVQYVTVEDDDNVYIKYVKVDERLRRRGIATALYDHVKRREGVSRLDSFGDVQTVAGREFRRAYGESIEERYGGAAKERNIYYHGTSSKNIRRILSQGLIPDPKERAWQTDPDASMFRPSRASYGGIYVTRDLMKAISSIPVADKRSGESKGAIVVMSLQPRALVADEDDFAQFMAEPGRMGARALDQREVAQLYMGLKLGNRADRETQQLVDELRDEYVTRSMETVQRKLAGDEMHPKLKERIQELIRDVAFPAAIKRAAAYFEAERGSTEEQWKRAYEEAVGARSGADVDRLDYSDMPEQPSQQEGEKAYRVAIGKLTRTAKDAARDAGTLLSTARSLEPINYKGNQRIVAVVELVPHPQMKYQKAIKVHYGELPQDFKDQWEEKVSGGSGLKIIEDVEWIEPSQIHERSDINDAYWYHPRSDTLIDLSEIATGDTTHSEIVYDHPEKFGLSREDVQNVVDSREEAVDEPALNELAEQRGWVRVRRYRDEWYLDVYEREDAAKALKRIVDDLSNINYLYVRARGESVDVQTTDPYGIQKFVKSRGRYTPESQMDERHAPSTIVQQLQDRKYPETGEEGKGYCFHWADGRAVCGFKHKSSAIAWLKDDPDSREVVKWWYGEPVIGRKQKRFSLRTSYTPKRKDESLEKERRGARKFERELMRDLGQAPPEDWPSEAAPVTAPDYLDIGHDPQHTIDLWWLNSQGRIETSRSEPGNVDTHTDYLPGDEDVEVSGRIDHDDQQISVASFGASERQVERAAEKLKRKYPDYEIWLFPDFEPPRLYEAVQWIDEGQSKSLWYTGDVFYEADPTLEHLEWLRLNRKLLDRREAEALDAARTIWKEQESVWKALAHFITETGWVRMRISGPRLYVLAPSERAGREAVMDFADEYGMGPDHLQAIDVDVADPNTLSGVKTGTVYKGRDLERLLESVQWIDEVATDKPASYSLEKEGQGHYVGLFTVDAKEDYQSFLQKVEFDVDFRSKGDLQRYEVTFHPSRDMARRLQKAPEKIRDKVEKQGPYGILGLAKSAGKVLSTVVQIVRHFLKKKRPDFLYFEAAESQRQKVYAHIVQRLRRDIERLGYEVERDNGDFMVKKVREVGESERELDDIISIQCQPGNYDHDPYMHGLANGMILGKHVGFDHHRSMEDPPFVSPPRKWAKDKPSESVEWLDSSDLMEVAGERYIEKNFLNGRHLVVDEGQYGWFRVFRVKEITSGDIKYWVEEDRTFATRDEAMAFLRDVHKRDRLEREYPVIADEMPKLERHLQKFEEASSSLQRLGFKRQRVTAIVRPFGAGERTRTGEKAAGYARRKEHVIEIQDLNLTSPDAVPIIAHEWAHMMWYQMPKDSKNKLFEFFRTKVIPAAQGPSGSEISDNAIEKAYRAFNRAYAKARGTSPKRVMELADQYGIDPDSIDKHGDQIIWDITLERGPVVATVNKAIKANEINPETKRHLSFRKGDEVKVSETPNGDLFIRGKRGNTDLTLSVPSIESVMERLDINWKRTEEMQGTSVGNTNPTRRLFRYAEEGTRMFADEDYAFYQGISAATRTLQDISNSSGFNVPIETTYDMWRNAARKDGFNPRQIFERVIRELGSVKDQEDTAISLQREWGKALRAKIARLGLAPSEYGAQNVLELWATMIEALVKEGQVPKPLQGVLKDIRMQESIDVTSMDESEPAGCDPEGRGIKWVEPAEIG